MQLIAVLYMTLRLPQERVSPTIYCSDNVINIAEPPVPPRYPEAGGELEDAPFAHSHVLYGPRSHLQEQPPGYEAYPRRAT